jgi:sugar lactone lactonase YvrE
MRAVADFDNACGECPVWDAERGALYWTDMIDQKFFLYQDGHAELLRSGLEINCFRLNQPGGFVIANTGGVWLWDGNDELRSVVQMVDGYRCLLNDCTADSGGRLLGGSCFFDDSLSYERGKLFRIDCDGKATILDDGFKLANGLGFSPDNDVLYFADSIERVIYAYDYNVRTGVAARRRTFVKVSSNEGLPDGLVVDSSGFVWSAQWYGSSVVRYDPDGKLERRITVPAKQTSSLAFGGKHLTEIYITSAGRSDPTSAMPPGYDPHIGPIGGQLFHEHVGIPGMVALKTNLQIIGNEDPCAPS